MEKMIAQLTQQNLLTERQVKTAIDLAKQYNLSLCNYLAKFNLVDAAVLTTLIQETYQLPIIHLNEIKKAEINRHLFSITQLKAWHIIPLKPTSRKIVLLLTDPSNIDAINHIKLFT